MSTMYIGPDLKGIVRHNQIFTYYPEKIIEKAREINPLAGYMFIQTEKVVISKNELRREGSFLSLIYKKIEKSRKKKEVDHGRL